MLLLAPLGLVVGVGLLVTHVAQHRPHPGPARAGGAAALAAIAGEADVHEGALGGCSRLRLVGRLLLG